MIVILNHSILTPHAIRFQILRPTLKLAGIYPKRVITDSPLVEKCKVIDVLEDYACEDIRMDYDSGYGFLACDLKSNRQLWFPPVQRYSHPDKSGSGVIFSINMQVLYFNHINHSFL